jgi:hypothetical protein
MLVSMMSIRYLILSPPCLILIFSLRFVRGDKSQLLFSGRISDAEWHSLPDVKVIAVSELHDLLPTGTMFENGSNLEALVYPIFAIG